MFELEGVGKAYPKGKLQVEALRDVSLTIGAGESVALVGPSGAGKSTLLNLLGLLDVPTQGRLNLLGQNPGEMSDRERSTFRGRTVGFVFQSFNLIPDMNAWQNVALPLRYSGVAKPERKKRALALLERVGMLERSNHYPSELSGGQEQRVAIARALVAKPKAVLADEPTGNLDSATQAGILALLDDLHAGGTTLVTVTHDPEVAARAGRQLRLVNGQLSPTLYSLTQTTK